MGLIGCYLAFGFDNQDHSGNIYYYYPKMNIHYPIFKLITNYSDNMKTKRDIIDISNTIGMYETSNNGPYNYIATKSTNINVPSDISLNKGDIFNYTDTEINKTFKIKLINNEKSGDNITRKLKYNKNVNKNFFKDPSFNDPFFYISANNSNINDLSSNMLSYYIYYLNNTCKDLIYKEVYYRISQIRFYEGNDLSSNNQYFNSPNKIIKKKLILDCIVEIYENNNLVDEINNNKLINILRFYTQVNKEDNINCLWKHCYDNLKILLKNYIDYNINNNEIFRYFDISSNIIDM